MVDLKRDHKLTIKISADELAMLQQVAAEDGVSASDFVRLHFRKVYAERHGTKKPTKN